MVNGRYYLARNLLTVQMLLQLIWVRLLPNLTLLQKNNYLTCIVRSFCSSRKPSSKSPGFTCETPSGVPVKIKSPLRSVIYFDTKLITFANECNIKLLFPD